MKRVGHLITGGALLLGLGACGSAGNDVPSGGNTGSNANVGGGATVVVSQATSVTNSPGQGSGSTLGASTPNPSPSAAR